ncbi:MAG: UDP-N-acetylmuramate dehydrogenase [Pseudomonadota bacterium]
MIEPQLLDALLDRFGEHLRVNEPMARHTTWRVGGPAELFFQPETEHELAALLSMLPIELPVHWVGLGSNLLVRDGGVSGLVITSRKMQRITEREGEYAVYASASLPCATLARSLVRWGMGPSEFFAGIPGSFGGALTMNAGAHGTETWDAVSRVRVIDRTGNVIERSADSFEVGYRSVVGLQGAWFVGAHLQFDETYVPSLAKLRELQARRHATQPIGLPSCGSVFANPQGDHSARLIEATGLKGYRLGGAEVSPKHANFIINTGDASAADIESLIDHVASQVAQEHGVHLRHEVRFLGEVAS